jgi:hypothetical protein
MDYDSSIDSQLLALPFHVLVTQDDSPLLAKLHYDPDDLTVNVLVTDLERAYHERLKPRQVTSRVLASGGAEGDVKKTVETLRDLVGSSSSVDVEPSDHGVSTRNNLRD